MSEVVVPIRQGVAPPPVSGTVDENVVKELEDLLERARSGEITGFASVSLCPGDLTTYGHAGRITRGVLGALTLLQYSLAKGDIEG